LKIPSGIPRNYDDNWTPKYFYILATCLTAALITTNIIGFKFIALFGTKFGAGTLMFPACLIVGDLTTEVYGFRRSRNVIFISVALFFAYTVVTQIAMILPPAPEWKHQLEFEAVFSQSPRLFVGGAFAYLAGELSNSWVMSKVKIINDGKYFWWRAMLSAVVGELANTTTYMIVAWGGIMTPGFLFQVILTGATIKIIVQTLVLPLTTALAVKFKKLEGVDHFDGRKTAQGIIPARD